MSAPRRPALMTLLLVATLVVACDDRAHPQAASVWPQAAAVWPATRGSAHRGACPAQLVFGEEFDEPALDPRRWTTRYWHGRTNPPEEQFYAPDAFALVDGVLQIRAERRAIGGMAYSSGLISTRNSFDFTYGYATMRARVPRGQGLWPAFWLVTHGTVRRPEIDVMEILGHQTERIYTILHYLDERGSHGQIAGSTDGPDFADDFHVFAVEWSAGAVNWYVDGRHVFRATKEIPHEPMYLIANLAVGGDWPGPPDGSTQFPATFAVDYIRVYQRICGQTPL